MYLIIYNKFTGKYSQIKNERAPNAENTLLIENFLNHLIHCQDFYFKQFPELYVSKILFLEVFIQLSVFEAL